MYPPPPKKVNNYTRDPAVSAFTCLLAATVALFACRIGSAPTADTGGTRVFDNPERVVMDLAERGTKLSNGLWVQEIRKQSESGKQTAILCTHQAMEQAPIAAAMFGRWSQENFFKYMRERYGIDRLISYGTEDVPETTKVVHPAYRTLDGQVRKKVSALTRKTAEFVATAALTHLCQELNATRLGMSMGIFR